MPAAPWFFATFSETMSNTNSVTAAAISVQSVSKWFGNGDDRRCVLHDVSVDIAPGEIVSIIGRSGVGKSTLLRAIGGLASIDSGTVTVNGMPVAEARSQKMFGLMPQSPALFPWRNVSDNVRLLSEVNNNNGREPMKTTDALATVGLADRAEAMPSELSGGMSQRVAIARALATRAPILLLDEPFSALDEVTRNELYSEVLRLWDDGDHTVILVTHNIVEAVLLSDRVVVLAGTPAEVVDIVEVKGVRPRTQAIDAGHYERFLQQLRTALAQVNE
jgi:NitT/TauT family transport system ATP-binding protein